MALDPVCRMQVDETRAVATADYGGQRYYFCCPTCKEKFLKNPERYLKTSGEPGRQAN